MNKTKQINLRVTKEEYEILSSKANNYGLTISRFLRDISMNYPVTCTIDQKAAQELLNIAGDLGRLGGLFKHWLVKTEETKPNFSKTKNYDDIDKIVNEILDLQILLKNQALKIIS